MHSQSQQLIAFTVAALTLLLAPGRLLADERTKPPVLADDVRVVLQERLAVLSEIAKLQRQGYESGEVQFDLVLEGEADVLAARLELAKTSDNRLAILEAMVGNAKELEKVAEKMFKAGEATYVARLKAGAFRLRAQADFLAAQSATE